MDNHDDVDHCLKLLHAEARAVISSGTSRMVKVSWTPVTWLLGGATS